MRAGTALVKLGGVTMLNRHVKTIWIMLFALSITAMTAGVGFCQSEEEVFIWTAQTLGVSPEVDMPAVHWVDQSALQAVFRSNNADAYLRWENSLGEKQARAVMDQFLNEIVGLYEPGTNVVYVGTFLAFCRGQAILAHEFTHFFQLTYKNDVMAWGEDAEATLKLVREMEASKIEKLFEQTFCKTDDVLETSPQWNIFSQMQSH